MTSTIKYKLKDKIILFLIELSGMLSSSKVSDQNISIEEVRQIEQNYIENQKEKIFEKIRFGNSNISISGDGIIAVYNIVKSIQNNVNFLDIVKFFEIHGRTLSEKVGITPSSVEEYFINNHYFIESLVSPTMNIDKLNSLDKAYNSFILLTQPEPDESYRSLHYVAIIHKDDQYKLYNALYYCSEHSTNLLSAILTLNKNESNPLKLLAINQKYSRRPQ